MSNYNNRFYMKSPVHITRNTHHNQQYAIPFNTNEQQYMVDLSQYFNNRSNYNSTPLVSSGTVNLNSINKKNEKSYKESSLEQFIFVSRLLPLSCVRVVCHSHTMQHFIKEFTQSYPGIKEAAKKNNAWTICLKSDNTNFIITRHGYSIANYIKDKSAIDYHKFNLYQQHQHNFESDPSLSLWGILTALYRGYVLNNEENEFLTTNGVNAYTEPNHINVSVLVRTWITAICLYLPYVTGDTLTLVVTPFISESGITPDNKPENIDKQKKKIIDFLNYLKQLQNILGSPITINNKKDTYSHLSNLFLDIIKLQLQQIYDFLTKSTNNIIIRHIDSDFSIHCGDNLTFSKPSENNSSENKPSITIYNGVCKPNELALIKMKIECENLSSKYINGKCNYRYDMSSKSGNKFSNICDGNQAGGNRLTKKKKNKKNRKLSKLRI